MLDEPAYKTLVLGVGNRLMSDEGVGVLVVEQLARRYRLPEEVQILDGGVLGLDLVYYLEGVDNLLLIDAVQADLEPGGLLRLEGDDAPAFLGMKISPHEIGVPDMLFAARLMGCYPQNVVLLGVQPEVVEIGLDLSPAVAVQVETLVAQALEQLKTWGYAVTPMPR
ncbi:MAG: HyaD/HybD family hydrogenase maturation endopeptidase [Chloroflexi bacterium]|nr:HyaD/HybD family hydrogenase maturation endopeptidase [Chloroflexota bacterium]